MMRRLPLAYGLLFLLTYAGFMSYYWGTSPQRESLLSMVNGHNQRQQPLNVRSQRENTAAGVAQQRQSVAADNAAMAGPGESTTPLAVTDGPSSPTIKEMTTFAELAISEPDPEQRSDYIVGMGNGTKMPNTIQALTIVITSDQVTDNRVLAVAALRTLSIQGDDDGSLRNALRLAATDSNSRVSAMAIEALKEVERRLGS